MNVRIQELASECGFRVQPDIYDRNQSFDIEKFSMLIIQDCLNIVEELPPGYRDYRDQIEDAFRRDCLHEIRQNFGIETPSE
jgi:hypothetical protein